MRPRPFRKKVPSSPWKGTFTAGMFHRRKYMLYVPTTYDVNAPLLVMLHGCSQSVEDFALGTRMNTYAEEYGFLVLYPAQSRTANPTRCWNWFKPQHQGRGMGEPTLIVGMVQQVQEEYDIDTTRTYVAGLSAGASMSVILGATYPDVFTAIAVCSGMSYLAANNVSSALLAMARGGPEPVPGGEAAYRSMGRYARPVPVIVFQGTEDHTVDPVNADRVIDQWLYTNQLASEGTLSEQTMNTQRTSGVVPFGRSFTEYSYQRRDGKVFLKKFFIEGMGHCWSGGSADGTFTDPKGPNASEMILEFFWQHTLVDTLAGYEEDDLLWDQAESAEVSPAMRARELWVRLGKSWQRVRNRVQDFFRQMGKDE